MSFFKFQSFFDSIRLRKKKSSTWPFFLHFYDLQRKYNFSFLRDSDSSNFQLVEWQISRKLVGRLLDGESVKFERHFPLFYPIWAYWACFTPGSTDRHPFFCFHNAQLERCTSTRDLIKATPLVKKSRIWQKKKKPSMWWDLNPWHPDYEGVLNRCATTAPQVWKTVFMPVANVDYWVWMVGHKKRALTW